MNLAADTPEEAVHILFQRTVRGRLVVEVGRGDRWLLKANPYVRLLTSHYSCVSLVGFS